MYNVVYLGNVIPNARKWHFGQGAETSTPTHPTLPTHFAFSRLPGASAPGLPHRVVAPREKISRAMGPRVERVGGGPPQARVSEQTLAKKTQMCKSCFALMLKLADPDPQSSVHDAPPTCKLETSCVFNQKRWVDHGVKVPQCNENLYAGCLLVNLQVSSLQNPSKKDTNNGTTTYVANKPMCVCVCVLGQPHACGGSVATLDG